MKKRNILLLSLAVLAFGGTAPLFAWDGAFFDLFQVPFSAREAALGGNHAAQADDVSTLVSNPAGFRSAGPDLSIGALDLSVYNGPNGPAGVTRSTLDVFGPVAIAYVGNGLGFGLFSDGDVNTLTTGTPPAGTSIATENIVLIAGYAFRIPLPDHLRSTLDIGFSVPLFLAMRAAASTDSLGLISSFLAPGRFVPPITFAAGVSAEFGALYNWNGVFSVGIAARNLAVTSWKTFATPADYQAGGGSVTTTPFPMDVSFGIRWNPPVKLLIRSVDGFSVEADYNDIFDFIIYPTQARNPLLHFGLGMEVTLLKIVKLRAGFYQLLPSGGIALNLGLFTLDMAVFGRELSTQPWGSPVYGYMAGLRFHV